MVKPDYASWSKTDLFFIFIGAGFLYLHLFSPSLTPIFYEEDHLYFMQDAWRMYRGESLYKDFFQYTFPGTQVLYLGLLNLFGAKYWLINAVIFAQGLSLTVIILAISKHLFGHRWLTYLAPCVFLFFGFRWFGIDGSHRMLSPICFMLAIFVLLGEKTLLKISLAGLFCALASYFTQQRGFAVVAAIGVFLLIEAIRKKTNWKKIFTEEAVLGLSFVTSLSILILPFVLSVGPATFFDYTFVYIKNYVQDPTANYGAYLLVLQRYAEMGIPVTAVSVFYYVLIPLVYLVALFFLWRAKYQPEVMLIALVGGFLALGTFAPTPFRLFQISMPAIIIFVWLISLIKWKSEILIKAAVVALIAIGCLTALRLQTGWEKIYLDTPSGRMIFLSPVVAERYRWLLENAEPGEYVFEVYQTAINFPIQHPNPTQITYLLDSGFTPEWMVRLAIENLEQKKPRFIIWDGKFSKEKSERAPGDPLAPLDDYLRENYRLRHEFTPYNNREMQVWQRKLDE